MTERPDEPSGAPSNRAQDTAPPAMPRWVKVSLILAALVLLIFVVLQLAGVGGRHGPGMHGAGGDARSGQAWTGSPPA